MPLPITFTGCSSFSMIGSPHFAQMRLVRWLTSSRLASDARAVLDSSPLRGISATPFQLMMNRFCSIGSHSLRFAQRPLPRRKRLPVIRQARSAIPPPLAGWLIAPRHRRKRPVTCLLSLQYTIGQRRLSNHSLLRGGQVGLRSAADSREGLTDKISGLLEGEEASIDQQVVEAWLLAVASIVAAQVS